MKTALIHAAILSLIAVLSSARADDVVVPTATQSTPDESVAVDTTAGNPAPESVDTPAAGDDLGTDNVDHGTDNNAVATDAPSTAHMMNTSARMKVGTGDDVGILGFVISGTGQHSVLIRGIGPSLAQFGLNGVLSDPKVAVYSGSSLLAENDDWSGSTGVTAASAATGAFALDPASKDAALVATLSPGAYTIVVSGVADTTGTAMVEVYDLP